MQKISFIILFGCLVLACCGCASLKEGTRQFLAISTRDIENSRSAAIAATVEYAYADCYQMVEDRLVEIGSYIYARRKGLIAVYISSTDTTPAGVFFEEIDAQKTRLEIASPAADTKEYLAEKIFALF